MAKLVLNSRDRVKPYVIVDDDDFEHLSQFNWTWGSGYAKTRLKQPDGSMKYVSMHRYITGAGEGEIVDHINRLKYDNRRENLRLVTAQQNAWNRSKPYNPRGTSEFVGVSLYRPDGPQRWVATLLGQSLGSYESEEEASYVRDQAAMQVFGEYAYLNFNYEPLT